MKKKFSILETLLAIALIIVSGIMFSQIKKVRSVKANLMSLIPGEALPVLNLVNLENEMFTSSVKNENNTMLIYVFGTPCAKCNKNLTAWKTLTKYFGNRVIAIGIIPDGDTSAVESISKQVNFKIFLPVEPELLMQKLRLKLKLSQTIVVQDNQVKNVTIGDLNKADLDALIKNTRQCIEGK